MVNRHTTDWTDEKLDTLRALWADASLSAAEIGRRLGITKNAVLGKAHRLDLPARENWIGRTGPRPGTTLLAYARHRRQNAALKAKREGAPAASKPPPSPVMAGEKSAQAAREAERRAFRPPVTHNSAPLHYASDQPCRWPTGDKATGGIRFECTAPREAARPYCAAHCARAYTSWGRDVAA